MASVDPVYAQWLQSDGLHQVATDAIAKGRWGTRAVLSARMTAIAQKADAEAEGQRRIAFLGTPAVVDRHQLKGKWAWAIGQVITLTGPKLGYDGGVGVFVLGAEDNYATGLSTVTVLRRLS